MIDRVLARFVLVGIGNTALGLGVIFIAKQFVPDLIANIIGYFVVVPISFLTHRDLSFQDKGNRLAAFGRYLPVIGVGYTANLALLTILLSLGANPYLAQACAIGVHVCVTYSLSRMLVFLNFSQGQDHGSESSPLS